MGEAIPIHSAERLDKEIERLSAQALHEIQENPDPPIEGLPPAELLKRALDFAHKWGEFRPMTRSNPPASDFELKLHIARQKTDQKYYVSRKETLAERFTSIGVSPATASSLSAVIMRKHNIKEAA